MKNLRTLTGRAALMAGAVNPALCSLVWQGDFGSGQPTGTGVWSQEGANPCVLSLAQPSSGNMREGSPVRGFKLGTRIRGDYDTEFVYARLVLGSTTDLLPGEVYQIDENFTAAKALTSSAVVSGRVGVAQVFSPATAAGTYFLWLAISGHIGIRAAASSVLGGVAETTATGGTAKMLISHTTGALTLNGLAASAASSNITFKGDTKNGSPVISNVASQISLEGATGGITDLLPGQTITGTGMPSNACIASIRKVANAWQIEIGTATTGAQRTLQNASADGTAVTITVTTLVQGVALYPLGAPAVN